MMRDNEHGTIAAFPQHDAAVTGAQESNSLHETAPSASRPPRLQRVQGRAVSVRVPRTPAFRAHALSIDVNVPENVPPVAMASPLAMFSTKKPQVNSSQSHPVVEIASDHRSLPHAFASPFLEYGMVVSLVCDDRNGIICAEGFGSREVRLEKLNMSYGGTNEVSDVSVATTAAPAHVPRLGLGSREERRLQAESGIRLLSSSYRDCLFEIVPKMSYDATTVLEELNAAHTRDRVNVSAPSLGAAVSGVRGPHSLADLKFKSDAEMRLNAMTYRKLKGSRVLYGQSIQLRHLKTGEYLCLDVSSIRLRVGEYSQVYLDKSSSRAHFAILPRFKLRAKGAPVQLTDQLLLASGNEEQPSSLYASNRPSSDGVSAVVVGSSVHSSQWRMVLFDRHEDQHHNTRGQPNESVIRAGCCVRLLHLESTCLLQYGPRRPREVPAVSLQFREETSNEETYEIDSGSGCLSSDSLWMVERAAIHEGGPIAWKDSVCFRHLVTGKYLAVEHSPRSPLPGVHSPGTRRRNSSTLIGHVVAADDPHAFSLVSTAVTDSDDRVGHKSVALMQHQSTKTCIHSPETHASSMTDIRISSKALNNGDNGGSAFSVAALPGTRDEDAFKILRVAQSEVDDTLLLISYKRVLRQFSFQFDRLREYSQSKDTSDSFSPSVIFGRDEVLQTMLQVERAVNELIQFCSEGMKRSQRVHQLRQGMFHTHEFIDILMEMIKAPFDRFGGPFSIDAVSSFNSSFKKQSRSAEDPDADLADEDLDCSSTIIPALKTMKTSSDRTTIDVGTSLPAMRFPVERLKMQQRLSSLSPSSNSQSDIYERVMLMLNRIIPSVNALLVQIFRGHRANEVYVAQNAMPILMELLGNGFQTSLPLSYLLRESRNIVESITAYGSIIRNFFELIKSRGRSIRYMQFLVALCVSRGRGVPKTQETICDLMFNPSHGFRDFALVPIRASVQGFEVFVASRRKRTDSSREVGARAASGDWISLPTLYQDYYVHGKHRSLGQYCYGLLQLYVALCLDRNYVSIDYVQQTFPRENLLNVAQDATVARSVRAVLLDLLRVAYVDCEPQKPVASPNYTRIWTQVGHKGHEVTLPDFSTGGYLPEDVAFFSRLKMACSSFFSDLRGRIVVDATPENQLTLAMLKMCKKMVDFGMYSSHRDLAGLVGALLDLLDERSDILTEVLEDTASNPATPPLSQHTTKRWFGRRSNAHAEGGVERLRGREVSVTDGIENLFTTVIVNGGDVIETRPAEQITGRSHHQPASEADVPLLLRLRNPSLLDSNPASALTHRKETITRQYGTSSLIWSQHCQGVHAHASQVHASTVSSGLSTTSQAIHRADIASREQPLTPIATQNSAISVHKATGADECYPRLHHGSSHENHSSDNADHVVLEIKDEICAILLLVDNIRLDFQISMFLSAFRSHHGNAEVDDAMWEEARTSFNGDVDEHGDRVGSISLRIESRDIRSANKLSTENVSPVAQFVFDKRSMDCKFSLSQLAKRNVNTVLMQMLMYEYPPLVSRALELLLQQFNQHDQLLSALQNLQLLVAEDTIAIYNRLKDDVNDLRRLSETTEVWMDLTSKSDFEKAEWACSLLRTIRHVINKHTLQASGQRYGSNKLIHDASPIVGVKPGSAAHTLQRRASSGKAVTPESVSFTSLISPPESASYVPKLTLEKAPPNRKLRLQTSLYVLNCDLGKVSRQSCCHELLPMAKCQVSDLQPLRKVRSHSAVMSMASEARRLLRNLKAAQYVISMMEDGAHFYEAHIQENETHSAGELPRSELVRLEQDRQRHQIRGVFEEALQFLNVFCARDAENQGILAAHATMIVQYVTDLDIAQQVLVSIYSTNIKLCKSVPTEVVNTFVNCLVKDPGNPRYLLFLETIVMCDENPVRENQLLVLFQLVKSFESAAILQHFDDPSKCQHLFSKLFSRFSQSLKGESGPPIPADHNDDDSTGERHPRGVDRGETAKPSPIRDVRNGKWIAHDSRLLEYHARLIHLLAACAAGKNSRCQEICQQIIPLPVVLQVLTMPQSTEGIQFALLRFLYEVFITAEDVGAMHEGNLQSVFAQISSVCHRVVLTYIQELYDEDVNRHAVLGLQKSKRFKEVASATGTKAKTPFESKALYLVIHGVVPTVLGLFQHFPQVLDTVHHDDAQGEHVVSLACSLGTMYAVSAVGELTLRDDTVAAIDELNLVMDRVMLIGGSPAGSATSLSVLWQGAECRVYRPDLARICLDEGLHSALLKLIHEGSAELPPEICTSGGDADTDSRQGELTILPHATHRTRRMRSKQESSTASDDGGFPRQVSGEIANVRGTRPVPLDRLHVVPPMVSGMHLQGGSSAKSPVPDANSHHHMSKWQSLDVKSGPSSRKHIEEDRRGKICDQSRRANSSAPSLLRRFGLGGAQRKNEHSIYSRHSALSIQCSSTGQINSSLFKNYQKEAAVRHHGRGTQRHQRFEAFDRFLWHLCSDPRVENAMREELNHMVDSILSVQASLQAEFDAGTHCSDIRLTFDQVVAKLVVHVLAFQDAGYVKTNLILLDVFCRMIYATEGNWERRHEMQIKLNRLHVTKLVVQLISTRDDDAIFERSVELGVALLDGMNAEVQETFHKYWLSLSEGSDFFGRIQQRIEKACRVIHGGYGSRSGGTGAGGTPFRGSSSIAQTKVRSSKDPEEREPWQIKRGSVMLKERRESTLLTASTHAVNSEASPQVVGGPMTLIFRFLQLLCEGHYLNAQRFFIFQPDAALSVNLVEATTTFLLDTYLALADLDVGLIIQLFETIAEFCQGPCIEAQETVANFKFFSTVNALLVHEFLDQETPTGIFLVRRLRASVVVTLLSLLEGRSDRAIHTQLAQELNFEALKINLTEVHDHFLAEYDGKYAGNVECSDDFYLDMGFNIYFLLQQLVDCFPSLASVLIPRARDHTVDSSNSDQRESQAAYLSAFSFFQTNSARVEVVWNHERDAASITTASGSRQRTRDTNEDGVVGLDESDGNIIAYYFPVHPICCCLTEQSKKKLVWHVSRGTNKLHDFFARSDKLVDEMAHQSRLLRQRSLAAFARSSDLLKRLSFVLAVAINLLVLIYYRADGIESKPYAASRITFLYPLEMVKPDPGDAARIGLSICGTIQLQLCVLILLCYLINSAPLLIKKGWKRRIRTQQEKLSKKKASIHRSSSDLDDKETFQDTEQLLRSLREREEEYDYLFLPHRQHARSHTAGDKTRPQPGPHDPVSQSSSRQRSIGDRDTSAPWWERLWRFLFGPASVMFRNEARGAVAGTLNGHSAATVTTSQYLKTVAISLYFLARSPRVLYYLWQIFIAILGSYVNSLFFAFHLLDVVNRYQELSNVLRSIVRPAKVLGVTMLLYLVVVYVFAVVGFYFFREDFNPRAPLTDAQRAGTEPYQCQQLFQCFLISLDQGFKSDGGLGGFLLYRTIGDSPQSYGRVIFDLLYNTVLLIMLLNIVFGVIIDTFASLRVADHEKLMDMQNRCFICSIDAYTFDRSTKRGFHDHIYSEHNMWHYLFLFVHIRKKPITEYNGLELYLAKRMAKKDVSFFPSHRALSLERSIDPAGEHVENTVDLFRAHHDDIDGGRGHTLRGTIRADGHLLRPASAGSRHGDAASAADRRDPPTNRSRSGAFVVSPRRVGPRRPCTSPSSSMDQSTIAKLDKLESTVQQLLGMQAELKEQHTRNLERQNELIELLVSMKHAKTAAATTTAPPPPPPEVNPAPIPSGIHARRSSTGIVQRSPAASTSSGPPHSSVSRPSRSPRVFNFDSIDEDA